MIIEFLKRVLAFFAKPQPAAEIPATPPVPDVIIPVIEKPMPDPYLTTIVPWISQKNIFHNVRVIADRVGLTYAQKEILCACIFQESRMQNYYLSGPKKGLPVTNPNKDKFGKTWSTDWGIVQCNDYYQIVGYGKATTFPSVAWVLANPEKMVEWMAKIYKNTGRLQPWSSFTSGAYKAHLLSTSPMQALRG